VACMPASDSRFAVRVSMTYAQSLHGDGGFAECGWDATGYDTLIYIYIGLDLIGMRGSGQPHYAIHRAQDRARCVRHAVPPNRTEGNHRDGSAAADLLYIHN